jgi:hypothetical protein
MSTGDDDEHAALANFKPSDTMHDAEIADGKAGERIEGKPLHFGHGHGRIRVVFEIKRAATARLVAYDSIEEADGSIFACTAFGEERSGINGLALEACMSRSKRKFRLAETATDGREKRDLISFGKRCSGQGKSLVDRNCDSSVIGSKRRIARTQRLPEIGNSGRGGQLDKELGSKHLTQAAEAKKLNTHESKITALTENRANRKMPLQRTIERWRAAEAKVSFTWR